ncbi:Sec-independent protein translocase protein TatB [Rhizobium sp. Leaf371]|uniref:Sec-independent protein translocase protein TatB n=1 Tax=Rhizobium sp. Leaf371 TaxID=1736355 RepID=UPI0009E97C59|nr:Sec-independent protein translocase protein TatB [Rhizobium sp. Leaf371]
MLDVGWTELVVIAIVLIIVVGPKDLPPMLRTFGKMMSKMRGMATDFRHQFDEALREADLDDVRKTLSDAQKLNPAHSLREAMNPLRQMGNDIKADLQKATRPDERPAAVMSDIPPAPEIAASVATPAEQPVAVAEGPAPDTNAAHQIAPAPVVSAPVVPVIAAPLATVTPFAAVAPVAAAAPLADGTSVGPKPRKRVAKSVAAAGEGQPVVSSRKKPVTAEPDTAPAKPRKRAAALAGDAEVAEIGAKISRRKKAVKADAPLETPITPKSGDEA